MFRSPPCQRSQQCSDRRVAAADQPGSEVGLKGREADDFEYVSSDESEAGTEASPPLGPKESMRFGGVLHLQSSPAGATVLIDNCVVGTTPMTWAKGTAGQMYHVEFRLRSVPLAASSAGYAFFWEKRRDWGIVIGLRRDSFNFLRSPSFCCASLKNVPRNDMNPSIFLLWQIFLTL